MSESPWFEVENDGNPLASTSVRITRREYMRLISQLDRAAGRPMPAFASTNRRTQNRIPFHREARLLLMLGTSEAKWPQFLVRCRNICKRGLAFLHESRIESGTKCEFTLIGSEHEAYEISATIARSRSIAESVHEIGVRFNHAVDLSLLIARPSSDGVLPLPATRDELRKRAAI